MEDGRRFGIEKMNSIRFEGVLLIGLVMCNSVHYLIILSM